MSPSPRHVLALAILSLIAGSAIAGTLTGTVRAAATGQPLGGKVVAAYAENGTLQGSATTDPTGFYSLNLPAGRYRVLAYDPLGELATMFDANAESFETSPVTTMTATGTVLRDFNLVAAGTVTGIVTSATGAPRGAATVEAYNLSGTRRGFTTTEANGTYSLVLPPGDYKLVAYDANPSFSFGFFRDVRTFAEATAVSVAASRATTGVSFRIELAARASGTVIDGATGQPLAGITVYAYTPEGAQVGVATTDASGAFRFALPPGDYRFVAADPARTFAPGFFGSFRAFETSTVVTLAAGAQQPNVQIALGRGATIDGVVRDAAGNPLPNVTVAAYNLDGTLHTTAMTDASGAYSLLVAPGSYKLAAFDAQLGWAARFFGGARDFASTGTLAVAVAQQIRGFDFALVRGGVVTGIVRDGTQPRAGITVAAYDATGVLAASDVTDAAGSYSFVVAPGEYRLVAFDADLQFAASYDRGAASFDQTAPRTIAANTTTAVDIALRRGVVVTGEVVDTKGNAVSDVDVFALDSSGNRVGGARTSGGAFSLNVPAGTYRFVVDDPSGRFAASEQTVVVPSGPLRFVVRAAPLKRRAVRH